MSAHHCRIGGRLSVRFVGVVAGLLCLGSLAQACLWDYDTLQMERRRFPGALELITGKFVRHSPAYYEWRIQDRNKRLRSPAQDPDLVDDLAVAYAKLGQHQQAIDLLMQVLQADPDRYKTLSNLGTVQMLAGDLAAGKEYIDKAIAIQPDAHFGRERYQSLLADYFLTARASPHPIPKALPGVMRQHGLGFGAFLLARKFGDQEPTPDQIKHELDAALTGVLGMMHFANYDSPLLLEALGDVLVSYPELEDDALLLAARAYYRIAQTATADAPRDEFTALTREVLDLNIDYHHLETDEQLKQFTKTLNLELAAGQEFAAQIAADERRWIDSGVDVDQAFAAKYYESLDDTISDAKARLALEPANRRMDPERRIVSFAMKLLDILGGLVLLGMVVFLGRWIIREMPSGR